MDNETVERRVGIALLDERVRNLQVDVQELLICIKGDNNGGSSILGRLGALERWRSWVNGVGAACGAAFTALTAYLGWRQS